MNQTTSVEDYGSLNNPLLSVNNRQLQSREQVFTKILAREATDPDVINERVFLRMSIYMLHNDRIYDLLSKTQPKVKLEQYLDQQSQ